MPRLYIDRRSGGQENTVGKHVCFSGELFQAEHSEELAILVGPSSFWSSLEEPERPFISADIFGRVTESISTFDYAAVIMSSVLAPGKRVNFR